MNREQLSDAIGRLDESIIEEAMTARRRRPWWISAVAVAACVALTVGMVAVWPHLKPDGVQPPIDSGVTSDTSSTSGTSGTTTRPTSPNNEQPVLPISHTLAKAQYPQMAQRVDYFEDEDGY